MAKGALNGAPQAASIKEKRDVNPSILVSRFPALEMVTALITREEVCRMCGRTVGICLHLFFSAGGKERSKASEPPWSRLNASRSQGSVSPTKHTCASAGQAIAFVLSQRCRHLSVLQYVLQAWLIYV